MQLRCNTHKLLRLRVRQQRKHAPARHAGAAAQVHVPQRAAALN